MTNGCPTILSADDAYPLCGASMPEPAEAEYAGTWDGSLGLGSGNWYINECPTCSASLIGWGYCLHDEINGGLICRVRWNGRRD
jgi:hypothetical protein